MRSSLRANRWLLLLVFCVAGVPAWGAEAVAPDRSMRMYRDPATGAVGPPSAAALRAEASAATTPVASAPLVEEPVQGPAGGVKVHLRGAHRPAVVRRVEPSGAVVHECVEGGAAADE